MRRAFPKRKLRYSWRWRLETSCDDGDGVVCGVVPGSGSVSFEEKRKVTVRMACDDGKVDLGFAGERSEKLKKEGTNSRRRVERSTAGLVWTKKQLSSRSNSHSREGHGEIETRYRRGSISKQKLEDVGN